MSINPDKKSDSKVRKRAEIETLYDTYAPRFLGLCFRYCGNREDAEDIMHEGFLHIIRNIDRFTPRGEGSVEAWMKKIMVNTALKYLRDHKKFRKLLVFDNIPADNDNYADENDFPYPDLRQEQLLRLITELPLGYRTVFNFFVMENYSHKEIAEMLGCTESTSKSQLLKARAWLKKRITESEKTKYHEQRTAPVR